MNDGSPSSIESSATLASSMWTRCDSFPMLNINYWHKFRPQKMEKGRIQTHMFSLQVGCVVCISQKCMTSRPIFSLAKIVYPRNCAIWPFAEKSVHITGIGCFLFKHCPYFGYSALDDAKKKAI